MTAIEAIGFGFFVFIVIGLAVALAVITRSIHQEEAAWTFSGAAPTRGARLTRRMLGAYCDPTWGWADAPDPGHDRAGQPA
jgi:hypothetical protein